MILIHFMILAPDFLLSILFHVISMSILSNDDVTGRLNVLFVNI